MRQSKTNAEPGDLRLRSETVLNLPIAEQASDPDALSEPLEDPRWLQALLEVISEGALLVEGDGVIRFANRLAARQFGWEQAELVGQGIASLLDMNSLPLSKFDGGVTAEANPILDRSGQRLVGRRKNGSEFDIEVRLCTYTRGGFPQFICMVTDLTEKIKAEKRLEIGERRFDLLFRAYPAPTFVWQRQEQDFVLIDFNNAASTFTQGSIQNLVGQELKSLYAGEKGVIEDIERCLVNREIINHELPGYRLRSTGEVKDVVASFVPVEPDLVLTIINDITPERRALTELKKLSNAVEQTADAVFITDRNAVIEYVNPAFEQMTGYSRAEALGQTPRILKSGQMTRDYYYRLWRSVLDGQVFRTQTFNRKKNGELFVVEQTITPMKDGNGRVTHFVSVLKDMTERIRLQEEQAELRLAGIVQQQLFPKQPPAVDGYDIAGAVFPANATSGDYFDYISMPANTIGFVVADVCDHGMGSALIMAEVRAYLRSIIRYESDLRRVLSELNLQLLGDLSESNFITMILARLDPVAHQLEYANAGNWPAYILDEKGNLVKELRNDGLPIGIYPQLELRQSEPVMLAPGSMVVFMTDGIPNAANQDGGEFGIEKALSVIQQYHQAPAREMIERVREAVLEYQGVARQDDDQTIIICKRLA